MNTAISPEFQGPVDGQHDPVTLVVEDEILVRMVIVDTLMDDGFEVIEATNGDEALLALSRRPDVDLIISDIEMPGTVNGFALARRVAEQRPGIRMILVSGRAAPRPGDLPAGAEFMPKPIYPEALLQAANRIIGR
ncbi:MAG TPA: response regulator [Microvirga sp.]|nr:response regulator [Microvirga sp.]